MTPEALAATHAAAFPGKGWPAADFRNYLAKPFHVVFGAEECFAVLSVIDAFAEILTLATHPGSQRQGRAAALLKDLDTTLRTQGVDQIELEVAADNSPAIGLYAAAGYARVGERKDYYRAPDGTRVTALRMRKTL